MPFQIKSLDDVPTDTPDVQIFFHGQLLLRSDGETCKVAVNPLADNHVLTIETRTKVPGQRDVIRMRHSGPLLPRQREDRLIEGMTITVEGGQDTPAAWKCIKTEVPSPIDYTSGESEPPDEDFRWILNFEGPLFHGMELIAPIFDSHHTIKLHGGQYFFRTAERAAARTVHRRRGGGKDPLTLRRIGVIASASVFLAEGQKVTLRWQAPALKGESTVTLLKAENTTHEIFVNNAPLFLDVPSEGEHPEFDELPQYYKLITNLPADPDVEFQLVPTILGDNGGDAGSPDIPCQVQRLDGTSD